MSKNPAFSIIVPCYNVENYIAECLNSIIKQKYTNFEVLVVDDCGQDSTIEIAEIFAKRDNRIKIIKHKKNKGLGAARNTALKKAKGKYIVCVDSDDYIKTDLLNDVYNKFKKTGLDVIWFKANKYIHLAQNTLSYNNYPIFSVAKEGIITLSDSNLIDFPLVSWNKAYNREFLINNNIFWTEGKKFEDVEFFWKVHTKTDTIYLIDKPLYVYRMRPNSICTTGGNDVIEDLYYVNTLVYKYLKESNLFPKYRTQYMRYVLDTLREKRVYNTPKVFAKMDLEYLKSINFPVDY